MTDNKTDGESPRGGSSDEERRRNRRYLRNRKRPRRGPGGREQEAAEPARGGGADAPGRSSEQPSRQRRRRRARRDSAADSQVEAASSVVDLDYVAPTSVFIYTHVVRSGLRESGYEFRSERFGTQGVGRRLEDYRLDLSVLFREEGAEGQEAPAAAVPPRAVDDRNFDAYEYEYEDEDEDAYDSPYPGDDEDESMTSQDGV